MCGILGFYRKDGELTKKQLRLATRKFAMALVALECRGTDAVGVYIVGSEGGINIVKGPGSAKSHVIEITKAILQYGGRCPIVIGHTRHATVGDPHDNCNNHPFSVGHIVGVHNGIYAGAWEPQDLRLRGECDSEVIFARLHKAGGERGYFKVLGSLNDFNRVVFFDRKNRTLYAYCQDKDGLFFCTDRRRGVVWMASTPQFLPAKHSTAPAEAGTLYALAKRTFKRSTVTTHKMCDTLPEVWGWWLYEDGMIGTAAPEKKQLAAGIPAGPALTKPLPKRTPLQTQRSIYSYGHYKDTARRQWQRQQELANDGVGWGSD